MAAWNHLGCAIDLVEIIECPNCTDIKARKRLIDRRTGNAIVIVTRLVFFAGV